MQDNPEEFEKLRKLLALKRRELPPPGYFGRFSQELMRRIEAGEEVRPGMWQQVLALFRARPAISWSFGVAAVFVLFAASNVFDSPPVGQRANSFPGMAAPVNSPAAASMMFSTNFSPPGFSQASMAFEPTAGRATNEAPKLDSLFSTPFYHQFQPASYAP